MSLLREKYLLYLPYAKGSFKNKLILVPTALLISAFAPWLIKPLLLIGGLYLCFEGIEKVLESLYPSSSHAPSDAKERIEEITCSLEEYEKKKVTGAIRTDFILSAEIIVIALGTVAQQELLVQLAVVSIVAVLMTVGVYGLVAGIVKLDDLGFYLKRKFDEQSWLSAIGQSLIVFAPKLMKALTVIGTLAMFLVGGGIVVHSFPALHNMIDPVAIEPIRKTLMNKLSPILLSGLIGAVTGLAVAGVKAGATKLKMKLW